MNEPFLCIGDYFFLKERGGQSSFNTRVLYRLVSREAEFLKIEATPFWRDTQDNPPALRRHEDAVFEKFYKRLYIVPLLNVGHIEPFSKSLAAAELAVDGRRKQPDEEKAR